MKSKQIVIFLAVAAISLTGYGTLPVLAEEKLVIEEKTYESFNPDGDWTDLFETELSKDGKQYKILEIRTKIIGSYPEQEETIIAVDSDRFFSIISADENPPAEVVEQGVMYYLKNSELIPGMTEKRTENKKTEITYNGVSYIDELPEQGTITVTDSTTGKQYKQELPQTGYRIAAERWMDDFSFPVTIFSVDADSYMLGTTEVPKGVDLSQYGVEFLDVLELSPDYYQITGIVLQGAPYEQDGEMIQTALAHGRRWVADIVATYEGSVIIPPEPYWYYQCEYSSIEPGEEIRTIYSIQATAKYELMDGAETAEALVTARKKPFWRQLIEFVPNPVTVAVLLILFFIIMVLILIRRKKKKQRPPITYIDGSDS